MINHSSQGPLLWKQDDTVLCTSAIDDRQLFDLPRADVYVVHRAGLFLQEDGKTDSVSVTQNANPAQRNVFSSHLPAIFS